MGQFIDLTGRRFGRWTVLYRGEDVYENGHPRVRWRCRCDCGTERDVAPNQLKNGRSMSCGCIQREVASARGSPNKTHGMSGTRLHRIWKGLNNRCNNKNSPKYERYGGRGICVCDEWRGKAGFVSFANWALASGYEDTLTIDRINNDGNYEPSNCRWTNNKNQANNKSVCRKISVGGNTKTIAEWVDYLGVPRWKLYYHSDKDTADLIGLYLEKHKS